MTLGQNALVKWKRLIESVPEAWVPHSQTAGSAGADLHAAVFGVIPPGAMVAVDTGLAVELPDGVAMLILPRSGLALKHMVTVMNAPGLVDSDYRGPVKVLLVNHHPSAPFAFERGDRIAQALLIEPLLMMSQIVHGLSETARGAGGFGSTGMAAGPIIPTPSTGG